MHAYVCILYAGEIDSNIVWGVIKTCALNDWGPALQLTFLKTEFTVPGICLIRWRRKEATFMRTYFLASNARNWLKKCCSIPWRQISIQPTRFIAKSLNFMEKIPRGGKWIRCIYYTRCRFLQLLKVWSGIKRRNNSTVFKFSTKENLLQSTNGPGS